MRNGVVIACLFAVLLNGCASRREEFVPTNVDHKKLAATIASQGQDFPREPEQPMGPPLHLNRPPGRLEQFQEDTRKLLIAAGVGVGIALLIVGWLVLEGLAAKSDGN